MIMNIRHTGIVVNDLETSSYFYETLLGLKVVKRMDESGKFIDHISALSDVKVTTVKMASPDGQMIELLKYHSHASESKDRNICDMGIAHIAFTVDDINSVYKRLKAEGVTFNSPPQLSTDGYAKVTFCRAPEGTFIEFVEVV